MSKQYESLTELIPVMEKDIYGGWNMQQKGDGTPDNPYVMPHVSFTPTVYSFLSEMARIEKQHPEFDWRNYMQYLVGRGYISGLSQGFPIEELQKVPIEKLTIEDVFMMYFAVQRTDRFCEGILLKFFKDGTILNWLKRVKELDTEDNG